MMPITYLGAMMVLKKLFPDAITSRLDADTTKQKGNLEKILSDFSEKKSNVLIGTQMIVKGHDFPDVTLVGILVADMSLHVNDYEEAVGLAHKLAKPAQVVLLSPACSSYDMFKNFEERGKKYKELVKAL